MVMVLSALVCAFGLAVFRRDTWVGRAIHELMIEAPARALDRGPWAVLAQITALTMLAVFAVFAPELIALAWAVDLALFVEVAGILMVLRARGWLQNARSLVTHVRRSISASLRIIEGRRQGKPRARDVRQIRRRPAKDADPDADGALALAGHRALSRDRRRLDKTTRALVERRLYLRGRGRPLRARHPNPRPFPHPPTGREQWARGVAAR